VQGNGQTELVAAVTGLIQPLHGTIVVAGANITGQGTNRAIAAGMGHIPEDRQQHGLVLSYTIADNMVLSTYDIAPFANGLIINEAAIAAQATTLVQRFDVRTGSIDALASTLSGGNQQKVVLGRALLTQPKVILLDEPTRGIDVGAKGEIYTIIQDLARSGVCVIVVSSELPEVLGVSDRIAVMRQGKIAAILDRTDATEEKLLKLALPLESTLAS
jgi:simple sugar transport system ATP-binding protein